MTMPSGRRTALKHVRAFALGIAVIFSLAACGGGDNPPLPTSPAPPAGSVAQAATISQQPRALEVIEGDTALFTVTASGTAPLSYQWRRDGVDIAGATGDTLSLANASLTLDGGSYIVVVSNSAGTAQSAAALLRVQAGQAPVILAQPLGLAGPTIGLLHVVTGTPARLSVVAEGRPAPSYQWRRNGVAITGATAPDFVSDPLDANDVGTVFDVLVSNRLGSTLSAVAQVRIAAQAQAPAITSQPDSVTVSAAASATFRVIASGVPSPNYQWTRNGQPIAGANQSELTLRTLVAADSGDRFAVIVSNDAGSATSTTALLNISNANPAAMLELLAGAPGGGGHVDGVGRNARLEGPRSVAIDAAGTIYFTDGHALRKATPGNEVVTVAAWKSTDSAITLASSGDSGARSGGVGFNNPGQIALDRDGNVFVADTGNHAIRKVTPAGILSTIAGRALGRGRPDATAQPGSAARFDAPEGIAVDSTGNVFVADTGNDVIRRITPAGEVTTYAGTGNHGSADGALTAATFRSPAVLTFASNGDLLVGDDDRVRRITATTVTTLVARLPSSSPVTGLAVEPGGVIYVTQGLIQGTSRISAIMTDGATVATLAGSATSGFADATGADARFDQPRGLAVTAAGAVLVADHGNNVLRFVGINSTVSTIAGRPELPQPATGGDGVGAQARFNFVTAQSQKARGDANVAAGPTGLVYVADNCAVRVLDTGNANAVSTLAGSTTCGSVDATGSAARFRGISGIAVSSGAGSEPVIWVSDNRAVIRRVTLQGEVTTPLGEVGARETVDGTGNQAHFDSPRGLFFDAPRRRLIVVEDNRVRAVASDMSVVTYAGDGLVGSDNGAGDTASFVVPVAAAADPDGNVLVTDTNAELRKITPGSTLQTRNVSHLAGRYPPGFSDGPGSLASFTHLAGIAIDSTGVAYVADTGNHAIRIVTPSGFVSTLALTSAQGERLLFPWGVALKDDKHLIVTAEDAVYQITLP
jgi:hypothetical protein